MRIPSDGLQRAKRALADAYADRVSIERNVIVEGRMTRQAVAEEVACHLSYDRGLGSRRSEMLQLDLAEGRVRGGCTLFFPPECGMQPGDLLQIWHEGRCLQARAGRVVRGSTVW